MYHMIKASVRDLRYEFKKIERLLLQGEEIQITKRRRVIARLVPESAEVPKKMPDFRARMRSIFERDLHEGLFQLRGLPERVFERAKQLSQQTTANLGTRTADLLHVAAAL